MLPFAIAAPGRPSARTLALVAPSYFPVAAALRHSRERGVA